MRGHFRFNNITMKHALLFLLLAFSCPVFSQKPFIRLPQEFENFRFDSTTVKEARKILGRPSKKFHSKMYALFSGGYCQRSYTARYTYTAPDCQLFFRSYGEEDRNAQPLREITLQKGTVFAPADFLQIGESTVNRVRGAFGAPVDASEVNEDIEYTLSYDLSCQHQDVRADFVFDGNHILKRVSVSMY